MKKQRVVRGIPVEEGSGNVYTDLGYRDSESMLVKAQLAAKIAEIIQRRALTQSRAAEILGLTQPKVSDLLKGRFRGISEHRFVGMPDPVRPGCPHCDQADAQESAERPTDALRSISTGCADCGDRLVPSGRIALRRRLCFHLGPLLFEAVHPHLQMAPVLHRHFQLPDLLDYVLEIAEADD